MWRARGTKSEIKSESRRNRKKRENQSVICMNRLRKERARCKNRAEAEQTGSAELVGSFYLTAFKMSEHSLMGQEGIVQVDVGHEVE